MASLDFDATEVVPSTGFDPIPAGKYRAVIEASQMKPTKKGGQYLELTFVVIEGDFTNRKIWARLNLQNQSQEAVNIARAELSAICRAVDVLKPGDSEDLHNIPLVINVKCRKRDDTGDITNEIKGYEADGTASAPAAPPRQQAAPRQAAPQQQAAQAPQRPAGPPKAAPWARPAKAADVPPITAPATADKPPF